MNSSRQLQLLLEEQARRMSEARQNDKCGLRDFPTIIVLKERIEGLEKQLMNLIRLDRTPIVIQALEDPRPPKIDIKFGTNDFGDSCAVVLLNGKPFGGSMLCWLPFFHQRLRRRIDQVVRTYTLLAMHDVGLKELSK